MPTRYCQFAPLSCLKVLLLLLLCVGQRTPAQEHLAMSHQAWSTEEGLPDASVHQVMQSRIGYLWLATERGAVRFDGSTFKLLRHDTEAAFSSDDVSSIVEDSAGRLWFGTADGLIEDKGGQFRRFAAKNGLLSAPVLQMAAAGDGSLVVLTATGLVQVRDERATPLASGLPETGALEAAPDGSVRLFTAAGTVLRYARGVVTAETRQVPGSDPVISEGQSAAGPAYVATMHEVFLTGQQPRRVWPATPQQAQLRITALLPAVDGGAWIGTNHGLFRQTTKPGSVPEPVDFLRNESVLALTMDREGDLWIGTEGSGLHVLRPRAFRSEAAAAGEAVTSVLGAVDGGVWFGTRDSGVQHIALNGSTTSLPAARLTSPRVLSLARGLHGELWIGTPDGLNCVEPDGKIQSFTSADGLPDDFVRSVLVDGQGAVWAGTRRGLAELARGAIRVLTSADGLPSDSIGPLLEGAPGTEELWVGTSSGLALLRHGHVMATGAETGEIVTALAADGAGGLWVGVHGKGLLRWAGGRLVTVAMPALPREVTSMHMDAAGFLWMRGEQGVYRAANASLLACSREPHACHAALATFGVADGMPSETLAAEGSPQIAESSEGQLWFSTRKGIAVADPAHLPAQSTAPPVVVQRVTVDGVEAVLTAGPLRVKPGHSRYVFDYAALSFRLPSKVRYRYRLEGFDRDWVDAGTARSAVYTGLSPRTYTFHVLAEDGDGVWSAPGASLTMRVLPPLYRRWWFALLVLLLAASLVTTGLRLRDRAVQRRFGLVLEERNRMAREIHDTLAQDFVSVSLQLDIASSYLRGGRADDAIAQLQATRTLVKDGLQAARQSIWNLRANAGEDSLPTRLSALALRYRFAGKPTQVTIGGAFRKLPPALEDEVLRVAGEALSNVDRHAGATEVQVDLRYEAEQLRLRVRDNGRGFVPEDALHMEGHYGVRGMHERARTLQAELRMESRPGKGTTLTLEVPLRAGK